MNLKKYEEYLKSVTCIQNVKLVITDMERVIFSYPDNKNNLKISDDVKNIVKENKEITMENNVFNRGEFSIIKEDFENGNIIKLFESDNVDISEYTAQMVVPISIDNKVLGSVIFYRDIKIKYPGKSFIKSKLPSIVITKTFLEDLLKKEVANNNCLKLINN